MSKRFFRNILLFGLFIVAPVAEAGTGNAESRALYHFGVFDYEEGDYKSAESHIKAALETDPGNPFYLRCMGKIALKTERFDEAVSFLEQAWKNRPAIPGLTTDLAYANFKSGRYERAAALWSEIAEREPENTTARYYAGMSFFKLKEYEKANRHFKPAEKNPEIQTDCRFLSGICLFRTEKFEEALEKFEYVRDNAESEELRNVAVRWIEAVRNRESSRPFSLWLSVSGQYDDNVRLEPPGMDVYTDEEDYALTAFFAGRYRFAEQKNFRAGIGYSHYQSLHLDLDEYDLTGAMPNVFAEAESGQFTFGLGYFPAWYWVDSENYLQRHRAVARLSAKPADGLNVGVSYEYSKDDYDRERGRNGHVNEVFFDASYNMAEHGLVLFGGTGFEDASASHPDYEFFRMKAKIGLSVELPKNFSFHLEGRYEGKKYDHADADSVWDVDRNDDKFYGAARLSKTLVPDWLAVSAEYAYAENDSNIIEKQYERNRLAVAFTVRY